MLERLEVLRSRTWNNPIAEITSFIKKTPFVIVGGVATRLYMVERRTQNLDILVLTEDAENVERELINVTAKKLGKLTFGGGRWELPDSSVLNVIESGDPWARYAVCSPNPDFTRYPIISLPYLVLMKLQASRGKDLADISRMLGGADNRTLQLTRAVIETYIDEASVDLENLIKAGKLEYETETARSGVRN